MVYVLKSQWNIRKRRMGMYSVPAYKQEYPNLQIQETSLEAHIRESTNLFELAVSIKGNLPEDL